MKNGTFLVSTKELAEAFGVSDRRVLQLVEAGIIDTVPGSGRTKVFDLETVVPQYSIYLLTQAADGSSAGTWAPGSRAQ